MNPAELRELLEMAAKAVGLDLTPIEVDNVEYQGDNRLIGFMTDPAKWQRGWFSPHADDGDSRRLEVDMEIAVEIHSGVAWAYTLDDRLSEILGEPLGSDPCAATRLAVLRAAAAIGRAMP
jgi:hypothetical protein